MSQLLGLLRVKHWIKNGVIFLPAFFGGVFFDSNNVYQLIQVFLLFSITASSVYVLNDLIDLKSDKQHPTKKNRPLASGKVKKQSAIILLILLYLIIVVSCFLLSFHKHVLIVLSVYFTNNVLYTFFLKKTPIIELLMVAIGFVLRIVIGALTVSILPSKWIIIVSFFIALYLIITKRRGELVNNNTSSRKVLNSYNLAFLDAIMYISLSGSLISYLMYSVEVDLTRRFNSDYIYITTIFVVIILFRHLQQTIVFNKTESPIQYFYTDIINFIAILGFLITFYFLIY